MKYIAIILVSLLSLVGVTVQGTEAKTISLLTCEPSNDQVYTAWGHTAVRVQDPTNGIDMVFNYGIFSFDDIGKFIYKFVKGETDYMLGVSTFQRSKRDAIKKNAKLYEQTLNLTEEEKDKICDALFENAKPENRYYRYNFFYDNCATRPRIIIENAINGEVTYPETQNERTYRDIIHELLSEMRWYTLGIDICLGSPTDEVVKGKEIQFLPVEMMKCFAKAQKADGTPIVKETHILYTPVSRTEEKDLPSRISPTFACWTFLLLIIAHTFFYTYIRKNDKWFDAFLFGVAGLVGLGVFALSFFSVHPCVFPNFNLLWVNPLQLIFALSLVTKKGSEWKRKYQILNFVLIMTVILLGWTILPQRFNINALPLMLSLAIRALHWFKPNLFELAQKKAKQI